MQNVKNRERSMKMEDQLNEELFEMLEDLAEKGNELHKSEYQTREFLRITDDDYYEEHEDEVKCIDVTDTERCRCVIEQARRKAWNYLSLSVTGFEALPKEIGSLKNLKRLYISKDDEGSIILPPEIGELTQLEVFFAYGCNMAALPEEFGRLTGLKRINLNQNDFKEFPLALLKLKNLESLAIDRSFQVLPDAICDLTKLRCLYLPQAKISALPENIGNLHELEVLCLWGTKVDRLPPSCRKLKKIKSLYLTKSIFEKIIPPEIIHQSPVEVIDYIVRYQDDGQKVEVNESKMIIVGQGGVGKTCLLNRLKNDRYNESESTEGIAIEPWEFEVSGKKYKLNAWDFGGQEIYHATHQFFLTNRSLYIFVWDARQEEEYGRIDYWLHTIESFAYKSPIIIVVNKCDSRNSVRQLDLKDIKERFPQVIDSFKVSCKENIGIENLRDVIEEETRKLPLMGMVWLSSWLNVRTELEELAKNTNIISYKRYQEICLKYHILSGEALSLGKYLHDLGIIINFQNDVYLKNIVILKPEWGTTAVYKVLDAQDTVLKDRNGILYYKDLSKIWKDADEYPEGTYPIILRLMVNFQLSFQVNDQGEYLIAELLDSTEVQIDLDMRGKQILNFQYNYDFLPAGIMTRFIVKANEYLVEKDGKKACWKKGTYLQYGNSIGFVKLFDSIAERRIEIKVVGANSRNNQELLTIIRKYFEEIHKSIPKIKFKEYVRCNCSKQCTYLHDFRYLLRLEEKGLASERCQHSLKLVDVCRLLNGVEDAKIRYKTRREKRMNIQVNPQISIENVNTSHSANSSDISVQNSITIEIRQNIHELQGSINDLKDETVCEHPELGKEFDKLDKGIERLSEAATKEEIVKSGALNKVKRFLLELQNEESELGKVIKGLTYGVGIAQEIGEKYNTIAEWCGLPVVPKIFLKKS